jgi:N-acetylglutamate synthase-like GNAT family acetyltransferase
MIDNVRIRKASLEDAREIGHLLAQLGHAYAEEGVRSNIEALSRNENDVLVVAESGPTLVGLAHLHVARLIHEPDRVARVAALVVRSDWRRKGIGRALMASLEKLAIEAGCSSVELTSSTRRDDAHIFYESLGYAQKSWRFAKELTNTSPDRRDPGTE